MAASVLFQWLSNAVSDSLLKSIFPEDAKIKMVSSLDKGASKKDDILNYRPVNFFDNVPKNAWKSY